MGVTLSRSLSAAPMYIVNSDGEIVNFIQLLSNLALAGTNTADATDTNGNPVPVYRILP